MSFLPVQSRLDTNSAFFHENRLAYNALLDEYQQKLSSVIQRDDQKSVVRHKERGKLLARERVDILIDKGTRFLEFSPLAALGQYNDDFPSAGIITGIGLVHSKPVVIVANDATVKGGTYIKETIKKHIRAQKIAMQNQLPCVYLVDSGGIFLPRQAEVFPDRFDFGRIFYNQARMSATGLAQISVVMGSCTAGGAYIPAMSDETVIVNNQGTIFIGGPPLVKSATGEEVTAEELGGGKVHAEISGVADYLAHDDIDALRICRNIIQTLPARNVRLPDAQVDEPLYLPVEMEGIVPLDVKKSFNAYEIIARLVDGSRLHEFKAGYGKTLVTGFAQIKGHAVGIIANNGFLNSESSLKAAHFVELCEQRGTPLLFLQSITGFIVGKKFEHQGIARDGAKFIHAVANTQVPKITIVIGGSFGAGNYAMSGRAFDPNFLFMWPNAKISVMGGIQAQQVLETIGANQQGLMEQFETEGSVYYSTSRLWDDGILLPSETRDTLGLLLSFVQKDEQKQNPFGIFRM